MWTWTSLSPDLLQKFSNLLLANLRKSCESWKFRENMKRPSKTSKKADKKAKPKTGEKREESPLLQLATTSSSSNTATTDSSPEVKSGSPMFGPLHSTPTLVIYRGSPFHGYAYPFIVSNQTALTILRPEVGTSPLPESDDENAVGKLEKSLIESGRKKDAKKKV